MTARDRGEIPQSGKASVIVYVSNVNDEPPVFGTGSEYQYASISEEQTVGSVVTIVQATDPDGDNVKYYFKRELVTALFIRIVQKTSVINFPIFRQLILMRRH